MNAIRIACAIGTLVGACVMPISAAAQTPAEPARPHSQSVERCGETGTEHLSDVWIDTRLETAYMFNRRLNGADIQTDVHDGAVRLSGTVQTDIDKALAGEIASSLGPVRSVDNELVVEPSARRPYTRHDDSFRQKVEDATMTALVKTRLIANSQLEGLDIDVDTNNEVVTLNGEVASTAERQLAELIAENTPDVKAVNNHLDVVETSSQRG
jgi:osmotically-inducible protein OsmY